MNVSIRSTYCDFDDKINEERLTFKLDTLVSFNGFTKPSIYFIPCKSRIISTTIVSKFFIKTKSKLVGSVGQNFFIVDSLFFVRFFGINQVSQVHFFSTIVNFYWSFHFQTDESLINCIVEVFSSLHVFLILKLDVSNVIVTNASCFVILAIKHVACFS